MQILHYPRDHTSVWLSWWWWRCWSRECRPDLLSIQPCLMLGGSSSSGRLAKALKKVDSKISLVSLGKLFNWYFDISGQEKFCHQLKVSWLFFLPFLHPLTWPDMVSKTDPPIVSSELMEKSSTWNQIQLYKSCFNLMADLAVMGRKA